MTNGSDAPARDLLADLTDAQRAAVTHGDGPLLILAGAGSRQDPRHHPPGRVPAPAGRPAGQHPGHHLHQQGRRRDAAAGRAARPRQPRLGQHLPQPRGPAPAAVRRPARTSTSNFTIYDMDDRNKLVKDGPRRAGHGQREVHPGADRRGDQQGEEPAAHARTQYEQTGRRLLRARPWPRCTRLREAAAGRQRAWTSTTCSTCRRWPCKHNEELRAEPRRPVQYVLIDEYQDTNPAQYEIARRLSHRPPEPVRGRRPRPVDLQVARLGHPEHPRLRARLPGRPGHHARARTTAARRRSCTPPARSSTTTSSGRRRRSSPTTRRASRSAC